MVSDVSRMLLTAWTRALKSPSAWCMRGFNGQTRLTLGSISRFSTQTSLSCLPKQQPRFWTQRTVHSAAAFRKQALDYRFFTSNASVAINPTPDAAATEATDELPVLSPPSVSIWLLASSALVFAVVVVGGVTRLTESGLSITEWKPVSGILPPSHPGGLGTGV